MALQYNSVAIGNFIDDEQGTNYATDEPIYIKTALGAFASIYADGDGDTEILQNGVQNVSDANGEFEFYVAPGDYIIEVAGKQRQFSATGYSYVEEHVSDLQGQINGKVGTSELASTGTEIIGHDTSGDIFDFIECLKKRKGGKLTDLVDKAKSLVDVKGMYVRAESNELFVGFNMSSPGKDDFATEYRFVPNGDNLLLLLGCAVNYTDPDSTRRYMPEITVDSGSINTSSAPSSYATSGTVVSTSFTGKEFLFRSFQDSRGGVWEVRLDGTNKNNSFTKKISTWKEVATPTTGIVQEVFRDLPYDTYSVKMSFLGDDPDHAPSGGTGTSRGWLYYTPAVANQQPCIRSRLSPINTTGRKWILPNNTILDFAISARPSLTSNTYQWVPVHSGVTGVSVDINYKLSVDGELITSTVGSVPDIDFTSIRSVEINQKFDAVNTGSPGVKMWEHYIVHQLNEIECELVISNRANFFIDTDVGLGYLNMHAAKTSDMTRAVFNNGNEVSPLIADGSNVYESYGYDSVGYCGYFDQVEGISHGVFASCDAADAGNFFTDLQPKRSGEVRTLRQHWRNDSDITKTYWTNMSERSSTDPDGAVPAGSVIKGRTRYFVLAGVRNPNSEILSL